MKEFSHILRTLVDEKGIPQKELAEQAGTTPATISRCMNGINDPSGELLYSIANALNVSLDFLTGRTPIMSIHSRQDGEEYLIGRAFGRCSRRDRDLILRILAEYMTEDEIKFFDRVGL